MLPAKSRVFAISRQLTRHILFATRNSLPTAHFSRSPYSTAKETTGLNDILTSWAEDEPETLPPLKNPNAKVMPAMDHEIPPLPENVLRPSYPSPHLDANQVQKYLHPLYSRGWGIQVIEKKGPSLSLDLEFSRFQKLCAFLPLLNEEMKKERHHSFVAYEFKVLRIRSQTHDAIANPGDTNITPGVTMHDVSLAIALEHQLEPFLQRGEVVRLSRKFRPGVIPTSLKCRACGGVHYTRSCPRRRDIKPDSPCIKCGGDHWSMDCPHNQTPWSTGS